MGLISPLEGFPVLTSTAVNRRAAAVAVCALTLLPLAACSDDQEATPATSATTGSAAATTEEPDVTPTAKATAKPAVNVSKVSADLRPIATAIYTGGAVSANQHARKAVQAFQVPARPASVTSTKASWKGTPIAVLTSGNDATFLVRSGGKWRVSGGWWPSLRVSGTYLGGKQFVFFMGSDARTQKGQKVTRSNADTLQVVGVDGKGGGGIMGMARDLWVPTACGGSAKLNAGLAKGGPECQTTTVRNATGLPVRKYLLTGFNDFIWMINAMGKVQVNATGALQTQGGFVPKGKSTLAGLKALWYARERKRTPGGDFGRSFNQGTILLGIAAQTRAQGPAKLVNVLGQASGHVVSNLSAEEALLFGAWVYRVKPAQVGHRVAKGPVGTSSGGASIVVLASEARSTFAAFRDGRL